MAIGSHALARYQRGFTYLGLLMFVIISGIALSSTGQVWHAEAQREKERELLFIGEQFRKAIGSYYESTPGGVKTYQGQGAIISFSHERETKKAAP